MGGYSPEFEISLLSGQTVLDNLSKEDFNAFAVHILRDGWKVVTSEGTFPIDKGDFSWKDERNKKRTFDVAFNAIHGHPGEDGVIQGYLDVLEVPYTSAGLFAAAFTFNKLQCSAYCKKLGAQIPPSIIIRKDAIPSAEEMIEKLGLPFFMKPNRSGSSFGVSRISKVLDVEKALHHAFEQDELVIAEMEVKGTELACGISDHNGLPEILGITEIVSKNDFFDYKAKYFGESEEITPARVSQSVSDEIERTSINLYRELELKGIARIDFILTENQIPYMIEVNSVPGLSPNSIVPQQAAQKKLALNELFSKNIRVCLK